MEYLLFWHCRLNKTRLQFQVFNPYIIIIVVKTFEVVTLHTYRSGKLNREKEFSNHAVSDNKLLSAV